MWARAQANIRDNIEETKRDKKKLHTIGRTKRGKEKKKIETYRATVDQGDKKKI